jgi:hypothetical protein
MPAWDEEQQVFKMWLITAPPNPQYAGTTYAESKDGIHWTQQPHAGGLFRIRGGIRGAETLEFAG